MIGEYLTVEIREAEAAAVRRLLADIPDGAILTVMLLGEEHEPETAPQLRVRANLARCPRCGFERKVSPGRDALCRSCRSATRTVCRNGLHPLTDLTPRGYCRECQRASERRYRARIRGAA